MGNGIKTFRNSRLRVCRQATGTWLSGWMCGLTPDVARIRLSSFAPLAVGERLIGECYGDGILVRFAGAARAQKGHEIALDLIGALGYAPCTETIRIRAEGLEAVVKKGDAAYPMAVLDISPPSLGGLVQGVFATGTLLDLNVLAPEGTIAAQVRVANCRPEASDPGTSRIGLQFTEIKRLDVARWQRLVETLVEV